MARKKMMTVIEGIPPHDRGQDAPIVSELLKMAGLECRRRDVEGASRKKEKKSFLDALECESRWIHISSHGTGRSLVVGEHETEISREDLKRHFEGKSSPLRDQLITLSACGSVAGKFATCLGKLGAVSVVRPLARVGFDEAAVFSVLLYFTLAKKPRRAKTDELIAQHIDCFKSASASYRMVGGTGAFRLDYWWRGKHGYLF